MYWLLIMLVIGIVAGRLSYRYTNGDLSRERRGGGLFLVAFACLPLLTACGGGPGDSGGDREMVSPSDPAASKASSDLCGLAILFLADPDTVCRVGKRSRAAPTPTPPPPAPPAPSGSISILGNAELEPNDDPINANAVRFAVSTGRVGFFVDGTVSDEDLHDTVTFARPRAADFNIELCPPGEMICEQTMPIDTGSAFYEVLDQDGRIVKSSGNDGTNVGRFRIDAGVAYYLRVVAGDTMGETIGYTLTAYETN